MTRSNELDPVPKVVPGARWNELAPVPNVVNSAQTDFLEKMSAASFDPSFLYQTTGSEVMRGPVLRNLINYLVDEFLREAGHGGGWR